MPKILDFKKYKQPFEIRSQSETKAEIAIYGAIGGGFFEEGIDAKTVLEEIKKLPKTVNEITVRINSPGGDVFQGIAIYNVLKQHKAKKKVYIDGLAASIASVIMLAGDEVIIGEGALVMVHLPWTWAAGNRNDLENSINRLMDVEEQMVSIYTKKTGLSRAEIKALLEKETWMDSEQAIDQGFVDSKVEDTVPIAASIVEKAPWIVKKPKLRNTEDNKVRSEIDNLKTKINSALARR
jgi:ATP-dependent Clp endopeptidase proteolytic subunit ClpP